MPTALSGDFVDLHAANAVIAAIALRNKNFRITGIAEVSLVSLRYGRGLDKSGRGRTSSQNGVSGTVRPDGNLLAWIEPRSADEFIAAFVGEWATSRLPAAQLCSMFDEAMDWIIEQAAAFGLPVKWVDEPAR
jgi:hypothetical protein